MEIIKAQSITLLLFIDFFLFVKSHDLKCTEKFCKLITAEKDCAPLLETCSSDNGEMFTNEVPCGCCQMCMEYIGINKYCSIGSPDTPPPMMMCGPRLSCQLDGEEHRCKTMQTKCFREWEQYNKTIEQNKPLKYNLKPSCDGDGNYGPIKCNIGQTCFCADEDGNRIFGEAIYNENSQFSMNCECSRANQKINVFNFKYPVLSARCLGDGSYDPLQCVDDLCTCVERETGSQIEKVTYNTTEVEYKNVPCFDRHMHMDWKYLEDCEQIINNYLNEVNQTSSNGLHSIDIKIEQCQPDGHFQSIREDGKSIFCVDKYNKLIENYIVDKDSEEAKTMNCKCARTQHLLKQNGKETAECCSNGNFRIMQCRKINDTSRECYCVDEDGLQTEKEVAEEDIAKLSCFAYREKCV